MDMHAVKSSMVHAVGYDPDTKTLRVQYHNGGSYHHSGVPDSTYQQLLKAPSVGTFINKRIKPHYGAHKI